MRDAPAQAEGFQATALRSPETCPEDRPHSRPQTQPRIPFVPERASDRTHHCHGRNPNLPAARRPETPGQPRCLAAPIRAQSRGARTRLTQPPGLPATQSGTPTAVSSRCFALSAHPACLPAFSVPGTRAEGTHPRGPPASRRPRAGCSYAGKPSHCRVNAG